jgi:hypothetical protein
MLLYINSEQKIPVGSVIQVPQMCVLFQERVDAIVDRKLMDSAKEFQERVDAIVDRKLMDSAKENPPKSYTYKIIIDEPIHDPLIQEQTDAVYVPTDIGLFYDHRTGGLTYEEFIKKITNINDSKDIYLTEQLLHQIKEIGFKGVWIFDNGKRNIITVTEIFGTIISEAK